MAPQASQCAAVCNTRHEAQHGKAAASGWIGSALEYYDFFIYAQAAALIFPGNLLVWRATRGGGRGV